MKGVTLVAAILLLLVAEALPAAARECVARIPPPATVAAMFDVAQALGEALDAREGTRVALVARGGQDLSRHGLRHSHLALAFREDGRPWRVVHLLNRCKSDESNLHLEGLGNFVGESAVRNDVRVGLFHADVQARILRLLTTGQDRARRLHEPRYSMVAYPFSTEFQNSNQWVLEVLATALAEGTTTIGNRRQAQAWLKASAYVPSRLHLKLSERVGARLFVAHVAVTDHPAKERIGGNYSVVTVESVFDFLDRRGVLVEDFSVAHAHASKGESP